MPAFLHTNLETLRNALIGALDTNTTVTNFWPTTELDIIINQALLQFAGMSNCFKSDINIPTIEDQRVYNIFDDDLITSSEKASPTLTYGDVINWLNIDLVESISEAAPTSDLFTLEGLLKSIQAKYNLFQANTSLVTTEQSLTAQAQDSVVALPDNLIDIIRVEYSYELDGVTYSNVLWQEDEEDISQTFDPTLVEQNIPLFYTRVFDSTKIIKLYPIPTLTGTLKIISVNGQDTSTEITVDTIINLPNNLVPYLKYHVLQDIYSSDGVLNNPSLANYCSSRWNEGIMLGKNYSIILLAKANGNNIDTDSINKLDDYSSPESTDDPPVVLGLAGVNTFITDTLPSDVVNSILLTVNNNAKLLVSDTDYVQIEIGYIDVLVNYCVHLCQFKCGIVGLANTGEYLKDFINAALGNNKRLMNRGLSYETLLGKSQLQQIQQPTLVGQST